MSKSPDSTVPPEVAKSLGGVLRKHWEAARDLAADGQQNETRARVAHQNLIDFLDAHGLTSSELDPRNESESIALRSVPDAGPLPQYLRF